MRKSIFLVCAQVATATQTIELQKTTNQLIDQLGLRDFDPVQYHQYDNYTSEDFDTNLGALVKEYFEGSTTASRVHRYRSTPMQERTSKEDQEYIKRFLQLKYAIMFLQKTKSIGRYCFYGCWCLPNGAADLGLGTGPPMDDIDRSCREFATCYNCLYNQEIGGACNEDNPGRYVIRGRTDPVTDKKTLYCMNAPGTCQRNRCECDRALAMKLGEFQDQWRPDYHRRRGNPPFDADAYCRIQAPSPVAAVSDGAVFEQSDVGAGGRGDFATMSALSNQAGGGGGGSVASVAGSVTINRVVSSAPIYGEIIGCCGRAPDVHYFRQGQKCCGDGEIVDYNAPCSMEFL